MIGQERTPLWQIARLRLRSLQGWGRDVPELRRYARAYARIASILPLFMIAYFALYLVIFGVSLRIGAGSAHLAPRLFTRNTLLISIVLWLIVFVVFAGLSAAHRRRADRGERQPPTTLDGYCYATVIASPTRLFARIGLARDQAQWFCLPIEWEPEVDPTGDRFELTYNPVTGFVERLRRFGAEPHEWTQMADAMANDGESEFAEADTTDGEATAAQRRELKRAVRRAGMAWGVSNRTLLSDGLAFLFGGATCIAMIGVALVVSHVYPQPHTGTADALAIGVLCGVLGIIGIGVLVWAALVLRLWARRRRQEAVTPVVIEGMRVCWMPYRDIYGSRNESLALVRLDDGSQLVFRIPGRWAQRLWSANSRVRVAYDEASGCVVDYRSLAMA